MENKNDCYWTFIDGDGKKYAYIYTEQLDKKLPVIIACYYYKLMEKTDKSTKNYALQYRVKYNSKIFKECMEILGLTKKHMSKERCGK